MSRRWKLAVLADDLTGALDTGACFAARGLPTVVLRHGQRLPDGAAAVVVIDTACRSSSAQEAEQRTLQAFRTARQLGCNRFFLKTDSGLRGNIGACMDALAHALQKSICFIPAHPREGRVTQKGVHFVQGVPVSQSVFGRDPLSPVRQDRVAALLRAQTGLPIAEDALPDEQRPGICVWSVQTEEEMTLAAARALSLWEHTVLSGCAGLADALARQLCPAPSPVSCRAFAAPALIVSGSVSAVALSQLQCLLLSGRARQASFSPSAPEEAARQAARLRALNVHSVIAAARTVSEAEAARYSALQTGMPLKAFARTVSQALGAAAASTLRLSPFGTLLVIGGDTLQAVLDELETEDLRIASPLPGGAVRCEIRCAAGVLPLISKSGSFGREDTLLQLLTDIENGK